MDPQTVAPAKFGDLILLYNLIMPSLNYTKLLFCIINNQLIYGEKEHLPIEKTLFWKFA